jgi:16S rRNA (cytosine967-C5)-methyltransferase
MRQASTTPSRGPRPKRPPAPPPEQAGLAARKLAADLVAAVHGGRMLDGAMEDDGARAAFAALDPRDRALARAIVGTTLRRHGQIARLLGRFIERPLPGERIFLRAALETALAQILFMEVSDHAAGALGVELVANDRASAPWKNLANAVIRRAGREGPALIAADDAARVNTPDWLMRRWTEAYGAGTAKAIATMNLVEPSLDISVKSDAAGWAEKLGGVLLPWGTVRLVSHGAIEKLPGFHEGEWWVQDAAAALPARLLGDVAGLAVADLCAAPGGKTASIAAAGGKVTAVDVNRRRSERIGENLERLGLAADIVIADAADWRGGSFDAVLLDAPCSATGTLRRHPDGAIGKRPGDVADLALLQRRLLDNAIRLVRPGGTLVFSTCSLEPEEGPEQIRRLLMIDAPVERIPVRPEEVGGHAELITADGDLRTLPVHLPNDDPRLAGLDGFYAARLRRL